MEFVTQNVGVKYRVPLIFQIKDTIEQSPTPSDPTSDNNETMIQLGLRPIVRINIYLLLWVSHPNGLPRKIVSNAFATVALSTAYASLPHSRSSSTPKRPDILYSAAKVNTELPPDLPRRHDALVALAAVREACRVASLLQPGYDENDSTRMQSTQATPTDSQNADVPTIRAKQFLEKPDLSPVTVADFAVQGLILHALGAVFPGDGFIAEEDSLSLRSDDVLCKQVAQAVLLSRAELLMAIDSGKSYKYWEDPNQDHSRPSRVWVLDPIDGTKGFLRGKYTGGQYAIALALLQDGVPVIGILGCPNLPVGADDEQYAWTAIQSDINNDQSKPLLPRGCIFVASLGGGCYQLSMEEKMDIEIKDIPVRLQVTPESSREIADARFCIGVERYSDALGQCAGIASILHGGATRALNAEGEIARVRRMDSQAKHGVIARGGAELYVRLPKPGYVEWIWDHAAGKVVIEEAGGAMTDVRGLSMDFSLGAQLSPEVKGVLVSCGGAFHDALVQAYAAVDQQSTD